MLGPETGTLLSGSVAVEFSRLAHVAWLEAFRLTTPGALLLGRFFSLWIWHMRSGSTWAL
jgi:hypothetical protein